MRILTKFLIAAAAFSVPATAFAYTLSGVIPPGRRTVRIELHRPLPPEIHFRFSAPPARVGVKYALSYCIGPESNPCGLPTDKVWTVDEGKTVSAAVPASELTGKVLVVGQGTAKPVPYRVEVS
jgi:hypothetical protein